MTSGFEVVRSAACDRDLELIFDHLFESYRELGDAPEEAFARAVQRLGGIEDDLDTLGEVPFQGTLAPRIMAGLRHVTKNRAVFYFVADEAARQVRVLAVFFGGQDHRSHILTRIGSPDG